MLHLFICFLESRSPIVGSKVPFSKLRWVSAASERNASKLSSTSLKVASSPRSKNVYTAAIPVSRRSSTETVFFYVVCRYLITCSTPASFKNATVALVRLHQRAILDTPYIERPIIRTTYKVFSTGTEMDWKNWVGMTRLLLDALFCVDIP